VKLAEPKAGPTLRYRADTEDENALAVGECFVQRVAGVLYLVYRWAERDENDFPALASTPIRIGEKVPEAWMLSRTELGAWQVSPSIRLSRDGRELWHETPAVVDVPEPPPWDTTNRKEQP
jgi:hypothetical protein